MSMERLTQSRAWPRARSLALWNALFVGAITVVKSGTNAVFLARATPALLPWLYVAVAAAVVGATALQSRLLSRQSPGELLMRWLTAVAALVATTGLAVALGVPGAAGTLYVLGEVAATTGSVLFWSSMADAFSPRDQRRAVGLVSSAGMLGAAAGGLLMAGVVPYAGALLPTAAAFILPATLAWMSRGLRTRKRNIPDGRRRISWNAWTQVWTDRHPRHIALVVLLIAVTGAVVDVAFRHSSATLSEADMARLFGHLNAWVGVAVVAMQTLVTPRLLERVGVFAFLSVVPVVLLTVGLGIAMGGGLEWLVVLKGVEMAGAFALYPAGIVLLYNPVAHAARAKLRAVVDGAVKKLGVAAAGLVLGLWGAQLHTAAAGALTAALAGMTLVGLWRTRQSYMHALLGRIGLIRHRPVRARLEVPDAATRHALRTQLTGENGHEAEVAFDVLRHHHLLTRDVMTEVWQHGSAAVQLRALNLVADLAVPPPWAAPAGVLTLFGAGKPRRVRAAAVRAYAKLAPERAPLIIAGLFADKDPGVQLAAIETGIAVGNVPGARERLDALVAELPTLGPAWQREVARTIGRLDIAAYDEQVMALLEGPDSTVQRVAAAAVARQRNTAHLPALVRLLENRDVRDEARSALAAFGDVAVPLLARALDEGERPLEQRLQIPRVLAMIGTQDAADALLFSNPRDHAQLQTRISARLFHMARHDSRLRFNRAQTDAAIRRRLAACRVYRPLARALRGSDERAVATLHRATQDRVALHLRIAFELLALHRGLDEMMTAHARLQSAPGSATREDAIELLHVLLESDPLHSAVIDAVTPGPTSMGPQDAARAVGALAQSRDTTLSALARGVLGRLRWTVPPHPSPDADILDVTRGDAMPDILIDRLFVLEHVDLFEGLRTDDLAAIAAICTEETLTAGTSLYRENDAGDAMYVIVSGQLELTRNAKRVMLLGPGASVGQVSLMDRGPRPVTASAADTDVTLLRIERTAFMDLLTDRGDLMRGMFAVLAARLRSLLDANTGSGPTERKST